MITPGYYLAKKAQENASDVSISLSALLHLILSPYSAASFIIWPRHHWATHTIVELWIKDTGFVCYLMYPASFIPFAAKIQEGFKQDEGHFTLPQPDFRGQPFSEERSED